MVVPNVMAYATHSAVGIYDSERHFLDLDELSPHLIGDALIAMVRHARAVRRYDPEAGWSSINANYLPPSGASLVHPHLQSAHDAQGLTNSASWRSGPRRGPDAKPTYWATLVDQEAGGPRWVGHTGRVAWLTPFAPTGFNEVWGVVQARPISSSSPRTTAGPWAKGCPASWPLPGWNLASFNFGIIGGGPRSGHNGFHVVLKVMSRSNPEPMYRSDATYFERLYGRGADRYQPGRGGRRFAGRILTHPAAARGTGIVCRSGATPASAGAANSSPPCSSGIPPPVRGRAPRTPGRPPRATLARNVHTSRAIA